ncbi:acyl-CoA dehydrogenase family protein [Pseudomonas sp. ERMR1:02]|uniref:acyl-CoA dehydrogenase family protein n=1 Tax=unclassified Pseudomonas TaxID=196821 RepID=UPI000BC38C40|nr:acyl-CoA dehydrogenase family protein [Pseudomonas sp. ERMR1:02]PAM81394.1 hypothetical protein CES87_25865 [Pseudomonas sp. ERMR1:02]
MQATHLQCYCALWLKEAGQSHNAEAAMNKWWDPGWRLTWSSSDCSPMATPAGCENVPFAKHLRDVLGLQIADGTAQIMKNIIARAHIPKFNLVCTGRQVTF